MSPPVWGRGLKHIEITNQHVIAKSPPVWGRGLKQT